MLLLLPKPTVNCQQMERAISAVRLFVYMYVIVTEGKPSPPDTVQYYVSTVPCNSCFPLIDLEDLKVRGQGRGITNCKNASCMLKIVCIRHFSCKNC